MMKLSLSCMLLLAVMSSVYVNAFTTSGTTVGTAYRSKYVTKKFSSAGNTRMMKMMTEEDHSTATSFYPFNKNIDHMDDTNSNKYNVDMKVIGSVISLMSMLLIPTDDAVANEYGIFAGRTASMLHPLSMSLLLVTSLYSGYLGLQWRNLRGISDQIKDLQASLPVLSSTNAKVTYPIKDSIEKINKEITQLVTAAATAATAATIPDDRISQLKKDIALLSSESVMNIDSEIVSLQTTRKTLQGANLKDKHFASGSILLGVGVTTSILGAFNTFMRAGKLFPGPHLYAGMFITISWAVAASLVPAMQKGNEAARIAHIGLNTANIAMFIWQVATGLDIVFKVYDHTSWP